ncbi:hypothetical protein M3Y94_00892200 [Aphelenchoides besseyi]|nr:hypothetical protein M3Y94_00892200 [Aphelenchoides besseyi]
MSSTRCEICSNQNASFHYGGVCCPSCKTFFRRTLRANSEYKCKKDNNCTITGSGHKACKSCRFKRCMELLNPKLLHSDRNSNSKSFVSSCETNIQTIEEQLSMMPIMEMNRKLNVPYEGPLGYKSGLKLPSNTDFRSLLEYFKCVDQFVDEYSETELNHVGPFANFDINLSVPEAFLHSPSRVSSRTKILWEANRWVTPDCVLKIWCRSMLHYIDLTSHIPELQKLEADDRLRMLVSRSLPFSGLTTIHRTLKYGNKKCILTTGGTYMPMEVEEIKQFKGSCTNNTPMQELNLTDEEFVLLRMILFFVPGPRLSQHALKSVQEAQSYYQSLLIEYLNSKYDRSTALQRLSDLLSFLPIVEGHSFIQENKMIAELLFTGMKGKLIYDFYISQTLRH